MNRAQWILAGVGVSALGFVLSANPVFLLMSASMTILAYFTKVFRGPQNPLSVRARVEPTRVTKFDTVEIRLTLHSSIDALVEVVDSLPGGLNVIEGSNHFVIHLKPHLTSQVVYRVRCERVGHHTIDHVFLKRIDPLRPIHWEQVVSAPRSITVVPLIEEEARLDRLPPAPSVDYAAVHSRIAGEGVEFFGLREYVPGDERRRISWKTMARTGRLYSKEFAVERTLVAYIVLDVASVDLSSFEDGAALATNIAKALLKSRNRVGLIGIQSIPIILRADWGRNQLSKLADAIVGLKPSTPYNFNYTAETLRKILTQNTVGLVVSSLQYTPLAELLSDLCLSGRRIVTLAIQPRTPPRDGRKRLHQGIQELTRDTNILFLQNNGVPVLEWDPEERATMVMEYLAAIAWR